MTAARQLGALLTRHGLGLVYGGAKIGLMGAVADAVLEKGGEVIGVIPEGLVTKEVAHSGLTDLRIVRSMHERKAMMESLADGFIALPGGFGTFEEFCEILTWAQLGIHRKPCGLLNVDGYYDGFLSFIDHAVSNGFIRTEHRGLLLADVDAESLLKRCKAYQPIEVKRWLRNLSES